jgi:hypothetical protein
MASAKQSALHMSAKTVPPTIRSKSFSCPRCGAHASQAWFAVYSEATEQAQIITKEMLDDYRDASESDKEPISKNIIKRLEKAVAGGIFLEKANNNNARDRVVNISVSQCYSCRELTVWMHDKILYPPVRYDIQPNDDLPEDLKKDFEEARAILDLSPRGAAALLRLCIQKLCKLLGQSGKDINSDIAGLVAGGLDVRVQKALDVVRVIGNEAVHPGTIDLRDDRETAAKLFALVNRIAYDMITHPKELEALYGTLPPAKLAAIEARDAANTKKPGG